MDGWAEFVGQWRTEIAHMQVSDEVNSRIGEMIEILCVTEPYLFHTCSRALELLRILQR